MKNIALALGGLIAAFLFVSQAHAQKEAMGMFYELQMAPSVCKWTNAGDPKKLNETIATQEQALGISPADKAAMMKAAEADLKSDPSNCAADGMVRPMYDEAIK